MSSANHHRIKKVRDGKDELRYLSWKSLLQACLLGINLLTEYFVAMQNLNNNCTLLSTVQQK